MQSPKAPSAPRNQDLLDPFYLFVQGKVRITGNPFAMCSVPNAARRLMQASVFYFKVTRFQSPGYTYLYCRMVSRYPPICQKFPPPRARVFR